MPGPQAGDEVEQLEADARIEADGRLVEEQHLGVRHQRPGDLEPAALATAVGPHRPVDELAETERVDDLGDAPRRVGRSSCPTAGRARARLRRPVSGRSTTGSWKTTALARRAANGSAATSNPARRARPDVGAMVVVSMPTVVDLPAPFGPSRPNTSPAATSKSMPFTASTPPG